jgi:hypothetical protein
MPKARPLSSPKNSAAFFWLPPRDGEAIVALEVRSEDAAARAAADNGWSGRHPISRLAV